MTPSRPVAPDSSGRARPGGGARPWLFGTCLSALVLGAMVHGTGCRGGGLAGALAQTPGYAPADQARCGVSRSQARPLIIEWPSHDRGTLESLVEGGRPLVAVRYEGCEMEVLPGCRAVGRYRYRGVQPKQDDHTFRHASDLYAKIPLGAASLEAELERHGALKLDMTVVGRYEAAEPRLARADLQGECERATHVITGLSVGAFRLASEAGARLRGEGRYYGAGAGAGSSAERGFERSDGDPDACEDGNDAGPPSRCRALLRVEVDPVREPEEIAAARARQVCPRGAALVEGGRYQPSAGGGAAEIADFCLDRTEVTVGDYATCAAKGPCSDAPTSARWEGIDAEDAALHGPLCNGDRTTRRNHPANCVSWHQADAYCRARGGRLPSEQEWEWAARGGEQERTYPWGEQEPGPRLANACGKECARHQARAKGQDRKDMSEEVFPQLYAASDGEEGTARVGSYPAGRGRGRVADLAGNVWEWTASAETTFTTAAESGEGWAISQGGPSGQRVARGGGFWSASDAEVRVTARELRDLKDRRPDLGFRCAYDP